MKSLLTFLALFLMLGGVASAETILLKCKFIDGKLDVYLANVVVKLQNQLILKKRLKLDLIQL